jgi:hypothetical protein
MDVDKWNKHLDAMNAKHKTGVPFTEQELAEDAAMMQELIDTGEVWWMDRELVLTAIHYIRIGACRFANRSYVSIGGIHIPSQAEFVEASKDVASAISLMEKFTSKN